MNIQKVLSRTKLSKTDLATLYGVSRQSMHSWCAGTLPRPGSPLARIAEAISAALLRQADKGVLPLPAAEKSIHRARITKMAAVLQALPLAPVK